MLHLTVALAALLALPSTSASPAISVKAAFEAQRPVRHFHDAAISPDGVRAAWSQKEPDAEGREIYGTISVRAVEGGGAARRLTASRDGRPHREWGAVFSPDGGTIAFLSDAVSPGQLQVFVAPAAGGAPRRLTRVKGQL
ncbi:MAG: hypothetical protein ACM3NW_12270, partial [Syntrophomonadaceae bacterium]